MPQVRIQDQLFDVAQRRAAQEGYSSVDDFVTDMLAQSLADDAAEFDHIFTPERMAELKDISAGIRAGGKTHTIAEVEDHFRSKREAWLAKHGS